MTKIELKHISKTIHKNEVLHDISFMMESGNCLLYTSPSPRD